MQEKDRKRKVAKEMTKKDVKAALGKVGAKIREKREADFTIDDFTFQTGVSRGNFSKLEKGSDMYLSTLLKILTGLGITPAEFFEELEK